MSSEEAATGAGTSIEAVWLAERRKFREAAARKEAKAALSGRHDAVMARAKRVFAERQAKGATPHELGYGSMPSAIVSSVGAQVQSAKPSAPSGVLTSRHATAFKEGGEGGVGPAAYGIPRLGREVRGGRFGEKSGAQAFARDGAAPAAHASLAAAAAAGASRGQLLRALGRSAGLVEPDRLTVPGPDAYRPTNGDVTDDRGSAAAAASRDPRRGASIVSRAAFGDYTQMYDVADTLGPGVCRDDSAFGRPAAPTQAQAPRFSLRARTAFGAVTSIGTDADEPSAASYGAGFARGAMGPQVESNRAYAGSAPLGGRWRTGPTESELAGGGPGVCREDTNFPPRPPQSEEERAAGGGGGGGGKVPDGGRWGTGFVDVAAAAAASFSGGATVPAMNAYFGAPEIFGATACGNPLALARRATTEARQRAQAARAKAVRDRVVAEEARVRAVKAARRAAGEGGGGGAAMGGEEGEEGEEGAEGHGAKRPVPLTAEQRAASAAASLAAARARAAVPSPGPASYHENIYEISGFEAQAESTKRSAPGMVIGAADRNAGGDSRSDGPGPAARALPTTVHGRQVLSRTKTAPIASLGGKWSDADPQFSADTLGPGPARYSASGMDLQSDLTSAQRRATTFVLGGAARWAKDDYNPVLDGAAGPQTYNVEPATSSFAPPDPRLQASRFPRAPAAALVGYHEHQPRFGDSQEPVGDLLGQFDALDLDHRLRREFGAEWDRRASERESGGGGAIGKQASSAKRSAPSFGFGDPMRSIPALAAVAALRKPPQRFKYATSDTPGPGAYEGHSNM